MTPDTPQPEKQERWTLWVCPVGHVYVQKDADDVPTTCQGPGMLAGWCQCRMERVEVMPVAEHEQFQHEAELAKAREITLTEVLEWLRGDEGERVRREADARAVPAEDALAHALEAALGQTEHVPEPVIAGPDPEADGPKTILRVEVSRRRTLDITVFLPMPEAWVRRVELAAPHVSDGWVIDRYSTEGVGWEISEKPGQEGEGDA